MARDSDAGRTVTRRSIVAAVAAGGATLPGAGGAAATLTTAPALGDLRARSGCDCSYEPRCATTVCSNGSPEEERRECCVCATGETACGSWNTIGCCDEIRT